MIFAGLLSLLTGLSHTLGAQSVITIGALKQVKQAGQLAGNVRLDTLSGASRYGLGPVAYLRGEVLIWDDTVYVSRVADAENVVAVEPSVATPFLVYASIPAWSRAYSVADTVASLLHLQQVAEQYAAVAGQSLDEPFPFVLRGKVPQLTYHVMNKPEGQTEHNPEIHRQAKRFYPLRSEPVVLLGFYSRQHEGVFTHHGSYIHVHVISDDRTQMGHLDEITALPNDLSIQFPVKK